MTDSPAVPGPLLERFGAGRFRTDPAVLDSVSADLSCEGFTRAVAVFAPRSAGELAGLLPAAAQAGLHVVARGAGMSYTRSHVPSAPRTLILDFAEMAAVTQVSARDRWALVQPGCTWERLYAATAQAGMRVPCWGPLSGRRSTVGGAVAQSGGFFGAAASGTARDCVLGVEVVLADGRLVRTGALAGPGFTAPSGPDLTGIFAGDSGAMGIKTAIALRLQPVPPRVAAASWRCRARAEALDLIEAVAALGIAAEIFAFDPLYHEFLTSLGFRDLAGAAWSVHATVESSSGAGITESLAALAAVRTPATRIDSSVPLSLRADPFGATQMIFSAATPGVHLPIHALVPPSRAQQAGQILDEFTAGHAAELLRHEIRTWGLMSAVGSQVLVECSLYFPGGYHDTGDPGGHRAAAVRLRREMVAALEQAAPAHFQLGKYYGLRDHVSADTWSLISGVKDVVDPDGLINPSALGLS